VILGFDTATAATTAAILDPATPVRPAAALDPATRATTSAILAPAGLRAGRSTGTHGGPRLELEARDDPPRGQRPRHAGKLLAVIAELLERAQCDWPDIERIAVGVGPGTFTGLRIGIATARALGQARGIPLVGVSTLRSLAQGARSAPISADARAVLAVLDARRGEVFAAGWRLEVPVGAGVPARDGRCEGLLAPRALAPEALAELIAGFGPGALALGDGAIMWRAVLERSGALIPADHSDLHRVTAINHCRLAGAMQPSAPDEVHPEYLRLADAEIALRAAGG